MKKSNTYKVLVSLFVVAGVLIFCNPVIKAFMPKSDWEDGTEFLRQAIKFSKSADYSGVIREYVYKKDSKDERIYYLSQKKIDDELRQRIQYITSNYNWMDYILKGADEYIYCKNDSWLVDNQIYYIHLSKEDWELVNKYAPMLNVNDYRYMYNEINPYINLETYLNKYVFRSNPKSFQLKQWNVKVIEMFSDHQKSFIGKFCIEEDSGMLVKYELYLNEHETIKFDLLDLNLQPKADDFYFPDEEKYYLKRLENFNQNQFNIDLKPFIVEETLPLAGVFTSQSVADNQLVAIFTDEQEYITVTVSLGRVAMIDLSDENLIKIKGISVSFDQYNNSTHLVFNNQGMMIKIDSNLSKSECISYVGKVIQELSKIDNLLLHHFPDLDQPNLDSRTQEIVSIDEIHEMIPFELKIPEFNGWSLSDEQQIISFNTSYKYRFFNHVLLRFERDDLALEMKMGIRDDHRANYEILDTLTYKEIEFTHYTYQVQSDEKGLVDYEGIKWKNGDLYYNLTLNQSGQGLVTLAEECVAQLGAINVIPEKIKVLRQVDHYSLRGTYQKFAPYFTERVIDFEEIDGYIRSNRVTYEDDKFTESIVFQYEKDGQKMDLAQCQNHVFWDWQEFFEIDGVVVKGYSYPAHSYRDNSKVTETKYVMAWSIEGYNFKLTGNDMNLMREFIKKLNVLVGVI